LVAPDEEHWLAFGLSPIERAVFLLREVFDYDYKEIAEIVEKTEDNCRQIFGRAKRHIEAGKPRFEAPVQKRDDLARRFFSACQAGNLQDLLDLLATDAAFYGDGGGKATAILQPVLGRERVARLVHGLFMKGKEIGIRLQLVEVNGQPGAQVRYAMWDQKVASRPASRASLRASQRRKCEVLV
jgi:Sigma-70, region 4